MGPKRRSLPSAAKRQDPQLHRHPLNIKYDVDSLRLDSAFRYANKREDRMAQHGEVKIIVKDGKKVEEC
jgi:hypothetical protein